MNQQQSQQLSLSESESETLRLASEFSALRSSSAWRTLRAHMQEMVDEAAQARDDARYAGDTVIASLQRIYQARLDFVNAIDSYMTSIAEAKRVTLHGIATSLGYSQAQADAAYAPFEGSE